MHSARRVATELIFSVVVILATCATRLSAEASGDVVIISDRQWTESGAVIDTIETFLGVNTSIGIWINPAALPATQIGSFDFLLCTRTGGVDFLYAEPGPELRGEWEYFSYRSGIAAGGCGAECDGLQLRVRGIANLTDGAEPDPEILELSGCVVRLVYVVGVDPAYWGYCLQTRFCSAECTDNVLVTRGGDTVFAASGGVQYAPGFEPYGCEGLEPDKARIPNLAFEDGHTCMRDPDSHGDMNLNGLKREIGDYVLFSNYFRYGDAVFQVSKSLQVWQSDYNNDGVPLTPVDLLMLRRFITGDWQQFTPFPY